MDEGRYQTLRFDRSGRVLTITIDTETELNVVTHRLHEEMAMVFDDVSDDPDSDVIVLTGAGQVFCAGGDVNWMRDQLENGMPPFVTESRTMKRIVRGLLDCPKPVIARVNGDAMGFGASIALLCDVVIAVDTALFADPHVRIGLSAGDGGALIWPQLIGYAKAKHYLLTGDSLDAVTAEKLGLISFAVPADELDAFVAKYVERLARGSQSAIRYTKITMNVGLRSLLTSVFEAGVAYEGLSQRTPDHGEGVRAFIERRRPSFGQL